MNDYIQAAFTSLEDLDKKENANVRKALMESRRKEKLKRQNSSILKYSGDPEKSIEFFNHSTELGAGSPTTGLGQSNNTDSSSAALGEDLKLDESLPRDLALAYNNLSRKEKERFFKKTKNQYGKFSPVVNLKGKVPQRFTRDDFPTVDIDYQKLDYKKLTKEEALAEPKGERDKLRVVVKIPISSDAYDPYSGRRGNIIAIFFDKDGKPLTRIKGSDTFEDIFNNYDVKNIYYIEDEDRYPNTKRIERDKKYDLTTSYAKKENKELEKLFKEVGIYLPLNEESKNRLLSEFNTYIMNHSSPYGDGDGYNGTDRSLLKLLDKYLNGNSLPYYTVNRGHRNHPEDYLGAHYDSDRRYLKSYKDQLDYAEKRIK